MTTGVSSLGAPDPAALEAVGDVVLKVLARLQDEDAGARAEAINMFETPRSVRHSRLTNVEEELPLER